MAAWLGKLAAQRRAFREKFQERQVLKVSSEDPDWEDLGHAFPPGTRPTGDAICRH